MDPESQHLNLDPDLDVDIVMDEIGRFFCKAHRRELCYECCFSCEAKNRIVEETTGLVNKRTPWEVVAEEMADASMELGKMERMNPRPPEATFVHYRKLVKAADKKLRKFAKKGHDVRAAFQKAMEKEQRGMHQFDAMVQAWKQEHPNSSPSSSYQVGGPDSQRLFDQVAAAPKSSNRRGQFFTCDFCKKSSTAELQCCARCKRVAYCNRDCQKLAWKAHKTGCTKWTGTKDPKALCLSWDELEAFGGRSAEGKVLEVRAVLDESMVRHSFKCKDRLGRLCSITAYTNSRSIPGLRQGSLIKWKNPRYHYFGGRLGGARIEEADLANITIS
ncbi:MAG: hypothetical protein SGBAC_001815 [Bacillariaceae sp.]